MIMARALGRINFRVILRRIYDTEALAVSDEKESSDPIVNPSLFSLYSLPHIYIYISTRPHTHKEKKGNKEKFRQKMTQ